jgi:hypothetical protein
LGRLDTSLVMISITSVAVFVMNIVDHLQHKIFLKCVHDFNKNPNSSSSFTLYRSSVLIGELNQRLAPYTAEYFECKILKSFGDIFLLVAPLLFLLGSL